MSKMFRGSEEWLAERARKAREWNGNAEPVKITSGGVESRHARQHPDGGESVAVFDRSDAAHRGREGVQELPKVATCDPSTLVTRAGPKAKDAGVAPGPLTHLDAIGSAQCKASVATVIAGGDTRKDSRRVVTASVTPATLRLPWPPSGNTAVRHANGVHYLRPEVTVYRQTVATLVVGAERAPDPYELYVLLSPPDRRSRDVDNALKSLLDALVLAKWLPGDSMAHMKKLTVTVRPDYCGMVYVTAYPAREAA